MGKAAANEPTKIRFTPGSAKTESIVDGPAKESLEDASRWRQGRSTAGAGRTGAGTGSRSGAWRRRRRAGKGDAAVLGAAAAAPGVSGLGAGDKAPLVAARLASPPPPPGLATVRLPLLRACRCRRSARCRRCRQPTIGLSRSASTGGGAAA